MNSGREEHKIMEGKKIFKGIMAKYFPDDVCHESSVSGSLTNLKQDK